MDVLVDEEIMISERLRAVRKHLKLSQVNFGKPLKIGQDAISDYENGKNEPSERTIEALIKEYSINKLWFKTGQGEMFDESQPISKEERGLIPAKRAQLYLSQLPEKDAADYIPYYDVEITAGKIELYFDDVEEIPEGYIYAPQYRNCIACNVKGDSMYEKIYPGARLYVYHLKNKKYIDFGQIYLIVIDGYRLLKYIDPDPKDESRVILRSHNREQYKDWPIEKADILNLFLVKGFENQNAN
jgi:phage repressor protein C with HTH and peptisase S24 domain